MGLSAPLHHPVSGRNVAIKALAATALKDEEKP